MRILVVNSAEEPARIRVELEKGADFAVLAREKSGRGRLTADFEGNQFTAWQLGDYLEVLMSGT